VNFNHADTTAQSHNFRYIDVTTYVFSRAQALIAITSAAVGGSNPGGYAVQADMAGIEDGTTYVNIYDENDVISVDGGQIEIAFEDTLEPKIYVQQ